MSYPPSEKEPECPYCREYGIPACCLAALIEHRASEDHVKEADE